MLLLRLRIQTLSNEWRFRRRSLWRNRPRCRVGRLEPLLPDGCNHHVYLIRLDNDELVGDVAPDFAPLLLVVIRPVAAVEAHVHGAKQHLNVLVRTDAHHGAVRSSQRIRNRPVKGKANYITCIQLADWQMRAGSVTAGDSVVPIMPIICHLNCHRRCRHNNYWCQNCSQTKTFYCNIDFQ